MLPTRYQRVTNGVAFVKTAQKKNRRTAWFCGSYLHISLSLGELRCATGTFETVFLSFLHSRVSGQEACLLESRTERLIVLEESSGKTVTDGTGLAGNATALDADDDVELLGEAEQLEGLTDDDLQGLKTEVIVDVSFVDGDLTGTRINANAGNGAFSAASAVIEITFVHVLPSLKIHVLPASEPHVCAQDQHRHADE